MKQKIKFWLSRIAIDLAPLLLTFATVAVIYALCRIKNYYCHSYLFSHEVYDCQVDASITVLVGFFLGYWVLAMMMKWRKCKLEKMKAQEGEKMNVSVDVGQGSATTTAFIEMGRALRKIGKVDRNNIDGTIYEQKKPKEKNQKETLGQMLFEDRFATLMEKDMQSKMTAQEIYERYTKVPVRYKRNTGLIAGFINPSFIIIGYTEPYIGEYTCQKLVDHIMEKEGTEYYAYKVGKDFSSSFDICPLSSACNYITPYFG